MQRQSLGGLSPSSKLLHMNGGSKEKLVVEEDDEQKRKDGGGGGGGGICTADEEESKVVKSKHRSSFRIEKSIHLIPIFLFFCFLILYLCSHDPSQQDLMNFNGFRRPWNKIDSTAIDDLERYLDIKTGDVLAIRSHRSLQEVEKLAKKSSRFHRKLGDF